MNFNPAVYERERERVKRRGRQDVFSFKNLLDAYYRCRERKRKTINAAKFELGFEKHLLKLEQELKNRTYEPGKSICFVVTHPTPREVFAADFRDRIVHHLLVNYLEPIWEKKCSARVKGSQGRFWCLENSQAVRF